MAQNIWQGTTGNYDTAGNWSLAAKPVATNDVVVPASITQAIESNADGEDAIDLNSIYIQRGHNQDVATSGVPWAISSAKLHHEGGGTLYFKAGSAAIAVNDTIINATPATAGKKSASLTGTAADDAYGNITVVRGDVDIEGVTFTIARLVVGFVGSQASDVQVDVKAANGLITEMHVYGGTVKLNRPVTRLIIYAGRVEIDDYVPVTVHQYGGVVEYMTPTSVGDITEYNLGAGFLDLTRAYLAHGITTLNLWGSPDVARYLVGQNTTITTTNNYRIAG
jgi:hypothetical protein